MVKTQYYRSGIVGVFSVLGIALIIFLLLIAKKGARMVATVMTNVVPGQVINNPITNAPIGTQPANPQQTVTTTNELPPGDYINLTIPSGDYNITSTSRNLFINAAPANGAINIFITPLIGSQGRSITITNRRPPPASNVFVTTRAGVQITTDTGAVRVLPGNQIVLVAIRDNVYMLKSSLL